MFVKLFGAGSYQSLKICSPALQKWPFLLEIWATWQRLPEQWVCGVSPAMAKLLLQRAGNLWRSKEKFRNSAQGRADHSLNNSLGEFIPPLLAKCPSSLGFVCAPLFTTSWVLWDWFLVQWPILQPDWGLDHPVLLQHGFLYSKFKSL